MDYRNGKNFQLINHVGLWHDLYNPALGEGHIFRVYGEFDLLVDEDITQSPEDFWIVSKDLDNETYAQPISGAVLADKLMTGGYVPVPK